MQRPPYAVKQPFAVDAGFADLAAGEQVVRREAEHLAHFGRAGIPVPEPVADRDGRFLVTVPERLGGGLVRLSTWVDGVAPRADFVPGLHATEIGTLLGRLHAAAPATDDPIGRWYRTAPEPASGPTWWTEAASRGATAWRRGWPTSTSSATSCASRRGDRPVRRRPPRPAPRQRPGDAAGQLVPVDWEDVGPVVPDRELAKVLVQWHVDGVEVDAPAVRRTVRAYRRRVARGGARDGRVHDAAQRRAQLPRPAGGRLARPGPEDAHRPHAVAEVQECLLWLPRAAPSSTSCTSWPPPDRAWSGHPADLAEWSAVPVQARARSCTVTHCGLLAGTPTPSSGTPRESCAVSPCSQTETGDTTTVAVKIRLKRMGKIRAPFYRVVVMDARAKRDGRAIEEIGKYHPTEEPSVIDINSDRAQYWLGQGAQPTEAVAALLKVTGDWQKYKGEPGTEGTLKVKAAKPSKKELYDAAIAAAGKSEAGADGSTTPKKRAAKKADEAPKADEPKAEEPKADEPKAEEPKADEAPVAADTDSGGASARVSTPTPTRPPRPRLRPRRPPRPPRPTPRTRPERVGRGARAPRQGHRRPQGRGCRATQGAPPW